MRQPISLALAAALLVACAGTGARAPQTTEVRRDAPVATAQAYEMSGTVEAVGAGLLGVGESVTIRRENAPAVQLRVADETRIMLDGRSARLSELREGDEVRAVFDFKDSTPVAIDVEAKKAAAR
jgi:Cu/Ag efflux protein CusF